MSTNVYKPDQKVSTAKKQDRDWYIGNCNYWIAKAKSLNDKVFTEECLNAANGIISDSVFEYVMNPLQMDADKLKKLPGNIRNIDFLTPIKEKNIGEYIQLPYQFHVISQSPDVAATRTLDVQKIIADKVKVLLAEAIQTGKLDESALEGIYKQANEDFKTWVDERADKGKKTINFTNTINNFDTERIQRFFYWWSCEEFYTFRRIVGNNVIDETISPLEGYPITTSKQFVEDYPGFLVQRKLNIFDIKTKYGEFLSDKDVKFLDELERSFKGGNDLPYGKYIDIYNLSDLSTLTNKVSRNREDIIKPTEDGFLFEYYVCFVTDVKRNILHYITESGAESTKVVDDDYEINPEFGEVSLEEKWIPEAWWQVRIGEEAEGIYIAPRPYEIQRYNIDGSVKIPFGGKKGLLRNNFLYPIPKRIIGSLALYQIINLNIERTIAKFKGPTEVIPQGIINGKSDADTQMNWFYKLADGTIIYDETKIGPDVVATGYRIVGNDSVISNYLKVLIDIRENIRQEAWDMANMNANRYGNAGSSETVRNNVSNIQLARLGSVLMVQMFNKALERDHSSTLEHAKIAYVEGRTGSYTGQDGKIEVLHLGKGDLLEEDLGVFVIDSILEDQKLQQYKDLAFNASQNGDVELAGAAIDADSSSGLRKYIKDFSVAKREFEMQMKEMDNKNIKMKIDGDNALLDKQHQNKLEEIELDQNKQTDREIALKQLDTNTKLEVAFDKNKTTLTKTQLDNIARIEQAKLKPKPTNNN